MNYDDDTVFGDAEPEDAWDRDDPVDALLDLLRRRLGLAPGDVAGLTLAELHGELVDVAEDMNRMRGGLDETARVRLEAILADLDFVGDRLARET